MTQSARLEFIDLTRGFVMVLMAWDHVTGFWNEVHGGLEGIIKTIPGNMDLIHFLSRFITHFSAPTFVFLAGTSIALMAMSKHRRGVSEGEITKHLLVRGLVLIALDYALVAPSYDLPNLAFGVLACIGVSMLVFSFARKLPADIIMLVSVLVILNNEFISLGFIPDTVAWGHYLRVILHEPGFTWIPYVGFYPVIPWIGVMGIGYWFGDLLTGLDSDGVSKLKTPLAGVGLLSFGLFFLVRHLNGYGNLIHRWGNGLMDWLWLSKYPPSIAFLLMGLGGACLFLAVSQLIADRGYTRNRIASSILVFGRDPLFFYLVHLWLYRLRPPGQMPPIYLTLPQTFVVWAAGLLVLQFLTSRFAAWKREHPDSMYSFI